MEMPNSKSKPAPHRENKTTEETFFLNDNSSQVGEQVFLVFV